MSVFAIFAEPHRRGLVANVAAFVVACLVVNGLVFGLGWAAASSANAAPLIPPGPVVGSVWTLLFALMGAARWAYLRDTRRGGRHGWAPAALAVLCLAFPFYTAGFSDQKAGFVGTAVTLGVATMVCGMLYRRAPLAAACIAPTVVWTGWVTMVGVVFGRI